MSLRSDVLLKALLDYKNILKKQLSTKQLSKRLETLGIKRKHLRTAQERELYAKAKYVLDDLEQQIANTAETPSWYSGIDAFYQHLKHVLAHYRVEDDHIVHTSQEASRALVSAVQLLNTPADRFNTKMATQLSACGDIIRKFGTAEQSKLFLNALKLQAKEHPAIFMPILDHYQHARHSAHHLAEV